MAPKEINSMMKELFEAPIRKMVNVKQFNQTLEAKLKIGFQKEVITTNFDENRLKEFSLETRNDPKT